MSALDKQVPTQFPVHPVLADRWSIRSFTDKAPTTEALGSFFEAARLAPSAHNNQPSRFVLTRKGHGDGHARLSACLADHNKTWAPRAPVLVLASVARERFSQREGRFVSYPHAMHDLGLAVMSGIVQATALGLRCHPMAAFEPDEARTAFDIPALFEPALIIAIGYPGPPEALPEPLRSREIAARTRRTLEELVFEGLWGQASPLVAGGRGQDEPRHHDRRAGR